MFRHARLVPLLLTVALASRAHAANPKPSPAPPAPPLAPPQLAPEPPARLIPDHGVASTSFARSWTESFVTGNGTLGAMVLGANTSAAPPRPHEDTLSFSHNRLYLPVGTREVVPQLGDSLTQLRQLIRTRGYGPAMTSALTAAQLQGFPGYLYGDPFLPALELKLKMPAAGITRDYLRTENFATGEVAIRWTDDAGSYLRKLFISRADNLAVLWIGPADPDPAAPAKTQPQPLSADFWIPPIPSIPVRTFQLNNPAAAPAQGAANALIQAGTDVDSTGITLHAQYREGHGSGYDAALRILPTGGTADTAEGHILVKDAQSILVLLRIQPFSKITSNSDRLLRDSLADLPPDYDQLLTPHLKLHQTLFNRVSLDLLGPARQQDRKQSSDALLARANSGTPAAPATLQPALLEKLYEASRYQLICSSGTRPPNLQGLWAATWAPTPTLAGDYAFNAPFHLAIASALSCNTPELLQGLFNLADDSLPDWQLNAKNLFNAHGILIPMHQSSSGKNFQWSDRLPASFCWTAGAALLAHWYYDYYLYTRDRQFLAQKALPFMQQAAAFYEDFLYLDSTGKYRFTPSDSTDNAPGDNSAVDIQAATELFTNLIAACQELQVEPEAVARWQRLLARMPPLLVAANGELQEWALPGISNKPFQRHIPHLTGIYQSRVIDPELTPELWKAARCAFESRLTTWFRPPTLPGETNPQPIQDRLQMGLAAARFGDGAEVGDILTRIAARNTYPSLMTQRYEDAHTFVADAAGALPEILNSALLDSRPGRIDLLPALPPQLPTGEIHGIAARASQSGPAPGGCGQLIINTLKWSPAALDLTLTSSTALQLSLHLPATCDAPLIRIITLPANQPTTLHFNRH